MPLNATSDSLDIQAYARSPLHHTHDGRSEDGLPNVPMRMTVIQYEPPEGPMHIPAPDYTRADWNNGALARLHGSKEPSLIRLYLSMIAALVVLFIIAALTSETVRATITACGSC